MLFGDFVNALYAFWRFFDVFLCFLVLFLFFSLGGGLFLVGFSSLCLFFLRIYVCVFFPLLRFMFFCVFSVVVRGNYGFLGFF